MIRFKNVKLFVMAACVAMALPASSQVLLEENFDSLTLVPFAEETGGDGTDVSPDAPAGWVVDNSQMPAATSSEDDGVVDWYGWSFADPQSWANAAGQRRQEFVDGLAQGVVAIADSDEWDDATNNGPFLGSLITPSIDLSGVTGATGQLTFVSSWRPEGSQFGFIYASFDGGADVQIFEMSSNSASPFYQDDNSISEILAVPFNIPTGAGAMTLRFEYGGGNNWWWAIDNVRVAVESPTPLASRSLSAPSFIVGEPVNVTLTLSLIEGFTTDTQVVETLPVGWSASNISNGGAANGNVITWNLAGISGETVLTYDAVASDSTASNVSISGEVGGLLAVSGESVLSQISPVGIFENHLDVGGPGAAGSATFEGDTYIIEGSGADIWGSADQMHFAYVEMSGPFVITADEVFVDPLSSQSDWVKAGFMVRDNLTPGSANAFAAARADNNYRPQFRSIQDAGSGGVDPQIPFNVHNGKFELERLGNTFNFYYTNGNGERIFHGSTTLTGISDPVFVGLAVTSHEDGTLSAAEFINVQINPYTFTTERVLPAAKFPWKGGLDGIQVKATPQPGESPSITVTETAPEGWVLSNVVKTIGTTSVSGNTITWTIPSLDAEATLTYDADSTGDETSAEWTGNTVGGDLNLSTPGPRKVFASAPEGFQTLLFEDFEDLPLGPAVDENPANGDGTDWTRETPEGWTRFDDVPGFDDPEQGREEWKGWSFSDIGFWQNADGQRRAEFTFGQGTIAVADPDEWDDTGHDPGTYNTDITTPPIDISARQSNEIILTFDSSWRPEDTQSARAQVSWDGGDREDIFVWLSDSSSPQYKNDDSTNEALFFVLTPPVDAQTVQFTWGMFDATNDWWWAIDNVAVAADTGAVQIPTVSLPVMEDFESVELGPFVNESGGDGSDWTSTPPSNWTVINDLPSGGYIEWAGWSFADKDAWAQVDDQQRSSFTAASGNVAVADPDEWDDGGPGAGTFNTFLRTPYISLDGVSANAVTLSFDSSWRPEDDQKVRIEVSFDDGAPVELLRWTSNSADATFHPDAVSESITLNVGNPAGANKMMISFIMFDAGNDWWWAIDNINITESTPIMDWTLY